MDFTRLALSKLKKLACKNPSRHHKQAFFSPWDLRIRFQHQVHNGG